MNRSKVYFGEWIHYATEERKTTDRHDVEVCYYHPARQDQYYHNLKLVDDSDGFHRQKRLFYSTFQYSCARNCFRKGKSSTSEITGT
jgi:hypothetical protein